MHLQTLPKRNDQNETDLVCLPVPTDLRLLRPKDFRQRPPSPRISPALQLQDAGESASSPLPTSMPCQEEAHKRSHGEDSIGEELSSKI